MNAKALALLVPLGIHFSPLAAQERAPGLGVGITVPDVGLLLPYNVSEHFRLEPYVMFVATRVENQVSSDTTWDSHTTVGLGMFSVSHPRQGVRVYFGPRFGLLWSATRSNGATLGSSSTSSSGWFLGGAIGGEYSLAPGLSMGGEAKIEYDHASLSSTASGSPAATFSARQWSSSGALVVRFYP